jgi:hypothetical protein
MSTHRSFTVIDVVTHSGRAKGKSNLGGRFISRTPASAAKKAATQICRESKIKGRCALDVTIQETTRGSSHKTYKYTVKRIKDPVTVERNGVEITYQYRTVVKAC